MSKRAGAALCFAAALCWMMAGLAGTIVGFLTSEGRFERALLKQVRWEALGIPQEELRAFARDTMRYFRGETDRWEPEVSAADGPVVISEAFARHMETVRRGVRTARTLAIAGAALGAGLIAPTVWKKRFSLAGYELGGLLPLALAAGLGLWAALDFSAMWGWLHRTFIPDGIFDAAEPVMRLFPGSLFAEYLPPALTAFGLTAAAVLGLPPLLRTGRRYFSRKRSNAETKDDLP